MSVLTDSVVRVLLKILANDGPIRERLSDPVAILQGAGVRPGQTALEVGCGRGFFTLPLAKMLGEEGRLYSLDITRVAVDIVTRKVESAGLSNVSVFQANAMDTDLPDSAVDIVLLLGMIPSPVLPLRRLLPEMHRVLRPGGTLAVWTAVPAWSPRSIVKSGLFAYMEKRDHSHSFRKL
jgi:demethylmenaquinone methyltransferase/2-methoxy-6-polyprenyl-1,4-benzoquinol methylase